MTAYYGANNTSAFQSEPSQKIPVGEQAGRLRVAYDSIDLSGQAALTTSDTVDFMKLPAGARVIEVILASDDVGTTGDANLGWTASDDGVEAADADGFLTAVDLNAAAVVHKMSDEANVPGQFKQFASEVTVQMVPSENFTATSGSVEVTVLYVLD
jgi:hypothetical protein